MFAQDAELLRRVVHATNEGTLKYQQQEDGMFQLATQHDQLQPLD
jgi:hypothetical protein